MLRSIHKIVGLFLILPLMVLVASGILLSVMPAADSAGAMAGQGTSVARLAGRIAASHSGLEEIKRLPSGKIVAFYAGEDGPAASIVDPVSGASVADYAPSGFERWIVNLHRSFFLGDGGRMAAGAGAFAMVVLALSGLSMTARRMGGWRHVFGRARGDGMQRLHVVAGRLAVFGLVTSASTALYLSSTTFGLVPDGRSPSLVVPATTIEGPALPVEQVAALRGVRLSLLRELTFPNPEVPNDLFHLATASGEGSIDPATGATLAWQPHSIARQIYEFIYKLHTGRGLWWLGLLLGASALGVPALGVSGVALWWKRRRTRAPNSGNAPATRADTVILVGSEGGSTWDFARSLSAALLANGHKVHVGPMDDLARAYPSARRMFLLTSTYGDGAAPGSAGAFVKRLDAIAEIPSFPVAVVGFGDRQFPKFCGFAGEVEAALVRKGWTLLVPLATIHRQSEQEFARWGEALAGVLQEKLALVPVRERPVTHALTLIDRTDYGAEVEAPTSVLRFAVPRARVLGRIVGGWPRFSAGDLLAVVPPGSSLARSYSLASSSEDGFIEICVRKHPGGVCSGFLHGLRVGESIDAFVKPNPAFRPARGQKPVVLIGAGTGVGPLAGHVRANVGHRPMYLYFGARHPASDFLYRNEITGWLEDERLTRAGAVFSRVEDGGYVQDRLRDDAERLRALVTRGAEIMVCGGRTMAAGVFQAMTDVLAPIGLTPATLKSQGRYAEDVY